MIRSSRFFGLHRETYIDEESATDKRPDLCRQHIRAIGQGSGAFVPNNAISASGLEKIKWPAPNGTLVRAIRFLFLSLGTATQVR